MEDADLLERARVGDSDAFAALVRPHAAAAIRLASVITGSVGDAEEATQEGVVHAYTALARFDPARPLRPWLLRIVANAAKNSSRAAHRRRTLETRWARATTERAARSAEDGALGVLAADDLLAAIAGLRDDERQVIAFRYFGGLSEQETALALGCPVGTVKSRHARALARLRHQLGSDDG